MPFYYMTFLLLDVYHNSLIIKTQKHLRRSVNFSRFIKITLFYIFFLYFYNRLIFGGLRFGRKAGLIYGTTFMLVFSWAYIRGTYIRGAYIRSFTVPKTWCPLDTGRKFNAHKVFRRHPEHLYLH